MVRLICYHTQILFSFLVAMERILRRCAQNIRSVFHHSIQQYRNNSRPKCNVIVDSEKQYFWVEVDDHFQFSFVINNSNNPPTQYNLNEPPIILVLQLKLQKTMVSIGQSNAEKVDITPQLSNIFGISNYISILKVSEVIL